MTTRAEIEDFLFHEAALLDAWELDAWLALWDPAGRYIVPAFDARAADPASALALIADDVPLLRARVDQLQRGHAWAEVPRSRTTRLLGNVRILTRDAARLAVTANGQVQRCQRDRIDVFVGRWDYQLVVAGDRGFAIREKRVTLAHDALAAGKISILL